MSKRSSGVLRRMGATFAAAAVVATSLVAVGVGATPASAAPFACDASTIYTQNGNGEIRTVDVSEGGGGLGGVHATGQRANALGISGGGTLSYTLDNSNGSGGNNKRLAIYDAATEQTQTRALGDPDVPGVIIRGAVSPTTGIYYYSGSGANSYIGAYDPATDTTIGQIGVLPTGVDGNGDFAFGANGELYVLAERDIFVVQPEDIPTTRGTGNIRLERVTQLPAGTQGNGIAFGANGKLFVSQANSISEVNLATGQMERTISTPGFSNTDMSSCSFPNTITLQKNVVDRYESGDQFALTIDGGSIDEAVSATTTGTSTGVQQVIAGPVFVNPGETYSLSESGAAGADLSTYDSSVSCVDSSGASIPTSGSGPAWDVVFPNGGNGENVICTITNDAHEYPAPGLDLRKTSDPVNGSVVTAGDTITYTVEAENTGNTVLDPVTIADDLSQVLDSGTYQDDVTTAIDGSEVTSGAATVADDVLAWTGILQPGQTVTITYSVIVNDDVEGQTLENRVTASGTPPNGDPVVPPAVVTEHPVAGFDITKTADPASGSVVEPGDTITYTVTGTNSGATLLDPASISDDLTDVLAHAAYNGDVAATTGDVSIADGTLGWSGALAPHESVEITYSVTVADDASDVVLHNIATGSATPQATDPANPDGPLLPGEPIVPAPVETVHTVLASGFAVSKSADPASGTAVNAGDTITYTVTGTNTGDTVLEPASISDDLSAVLGSADYNDDVVATVGQADVADGVLTWSGRLEPGASVEITYSVTVAEDATGVLLRNVVSGEATPLIPEDPSDPESPTTPGDPITPPPAETEHPVVNPGFSVAKSADPASGTAVNAGDTITYTVTGTNSGDTVLEPASISDDLSAVLGSADYNDDVVASVGTVAIDGGVLSWSGALEAGQSVEITYSVTVADDATGVLLRNVVSGEATPLIPEDPSDPESPTTPGDPITPPPAETEHPVVNPGFEIAKTADPASGSMLSAGDTITYTVTGTNTGDTLLDPVSVADDLSDVIAHAAYNGDVSASTGSVSIEGDELRWNGVLGAGETVTITYSVTVNADAGGQVLSNTASGEGTPQIPVDPSDPESPTTPGDPITPPPAETEHPVADPGFEISKTADPASGKNVDPDDVVTYTVTGANTGDTLLDPVSIADDLSDVLTHAVYNGDVSASTGSVSIEGDELRWNGVLAAGESVTITYSVTVNADAGGEVLSNIASGEGTPQIPVDPSDPESPTTPGDPITPPPAETEHPVTPAPPSEEPPATNPGFEITKTSDPASGTAVNAGDTITYTVTGTNSGDTMLDPASIADDLSAVLSSASYNDDAAATVGEATVADGVLSWTGPLGIGESVEITYSVTVADDASGVLLRNVVSGEATPLIPSDPSDPESPTTPGDPLTPPLAETEHPVNAPGFELGKSVDPASGTAVEPGAVLTYTVTGANTGDTALDPVSIRDDLSGVLAHAEYNDDAVATVNGAPAAAPTVNDAELAWNGVLGVGETVTITYTVTVGADAGGANLVNVVTGEATPPGGDGFRLVPPPVETDNPVNVPGFSVSKSADPASGTAVDPGSVITYTVTGANTGDSPLDPVSILDDLSGVLAHADYNGDVTASTGQASVEGDELAWNGALASGESVTITYSVTVHGDAGGETLRNRVTGSATPEGAPPIETPPAETTHPVNEPGFQLAKVVDPSDGTAVDPGSVLTYTVTGVNTGDTVLAPVEIVDDLSGVLAHTVYNGDATASVGDVTVDGVELRWTGELGVGESVTLTYSVTVNGDAGGETLRNAVSGWATPPGGTELTPPPSTTENPVNEPGFEFSKTADPASGTTVAVGSVVTYTLTGANTGQTALDDITITDDLSNVLAFATYRDDAVAQIAGAEVAGLEIEGDRLVWKGALQAGETLTITYSVTVNEDAAGQILKNEAVAEATPPGGDPITPPAGSTEHPVQTELAATGEQMAPWLAMLGGLVAAGGLVLLTRRLRTVTR